MQKRKLALAIAVAWAAPITALADDNSTVTVYGHMKVYFDSVEAPGATTPGQDLASRNRVSPATSHIGFRGSEPLGGGTNAFFQVESNAQPDTGGGTWASRNSAVGLNGNWGAVLLGFWDTPLKLSTGKLDPFGNDIGDASPMLRNGGAVAGNVIGGNVPAGVIPGNPTTLSTNRASFHRRQQNNVQYWTPNLSGFSGRLMYSANEEKTAAASPSLWSGSATYDKGPFFVTFGYELHKNYGGNGLDDQGWNVGAAFKFGGTQIGVAYAHLEYEIDGSVAGNCVVGASRCTGEIKGNWLVSAVHTMGPHQFRGYYQRARDPDGDATTRIGNAGAPSTGNGGAKQFVLGYGYSFSKRTELFALYSRITNEANANYDFGTNSIVGANALPLGSDPRGFGLGVRHNF